MPRENGPWEFPFLPGEFVIFRHCVPFSDEPHQLSVTVETVEPSKKGFDVSIRTEGGERFLIKGVNRGNLSLVFEP